MSYYYEDYLESKSYKIELCAQLQTSLSLFPSLSLSLSLTLHEVQNPDPQLL